VQVNESLVLRGLVLDAVDVAAVFDRFRQGDSASAASTAVTARGHRLFSCV